MKLVVTCNAQAAAPISIGQGTPVRPTSVLVVGATGTLGRQVVRRALDEGYDVRCLVRPRPAPADFLRDWGATVVNADLSKPETIPATLVGVHTVIDCATGRPEEPIRTVDWEGKVALIQCAKAMGIQKYVFYSIHNCDKHPEVPLMEIKYCTEKFIQDTGLDYTIIRLCGFMQPLTQTLSPSRRPADFVAGVLSGVAPRACFGSGKRHDLGPADIPMGVC
uniref:Uncharacterized protein n=1 Tax=Avena sativa TaxID=4498 RepID=A0ACD6AT68_AVESA